MEREKLTDRTCVRCGATIHLAKTSGETFKWVTNINKPKDTWRCGNDPDYPVRSHSPSPSP